MKKKIIDYFKNYYKKKSKWSVATDILFFLLILLLIIPATRKHVGSFFIKSTLRAPLVIRAEDGQHLSEADYRWPLQTLKGTPFYLEMNKVVFLNFWATWCPPCIAEMPSIQRLYDLYSEQVEFVIITQEDPSVVEAFMKKNGYNFPVHIQQYQSPEIFSSNSIPTTFIIDTEGKILLKKKGAAKWDSNKIKNLLDQALNPVP